MPSFRPVSLSRESHRPRPALATLAAALVVGLAVLGGLAGCPAAALATHAAIHGFAPALPLVAALPAPLAAHPPPPAWGHSLPVNEPWAALQRGPKTPAHTSAAGSGMMGTLPAASLAVGLAVLGAGAALLGVRQRDTEQEQALHWVTSRRRALWHGGALAGVGALAARPAAAATGLEQAARLMGLDDNADLYYPEEFLGAWQCVSVLRSIEVPNGSETYPDQAEMRRMEAYLNVPFFYPQRFIRNPAGKVVADRRFNTQAMAEAYIRFQGYDPSAMPSVGYEWDAANPGILTLQLPSGEILTTIVTNRVQDSAGPGRLDTVERSQQFKERALQPQQGKAYQTVTKWLWKDLPTVAGPAPQDLQLIATQQVTEYLSADADLLKVLRTLGGPVAVYNYRIALKRLPPRATPQSGPSRRLPG
eukprot:EG_transcript_10708